jgi:hypothetical protein
LDTYNKVINKVGGLVPLAATAVNSFAPGAGTALQTGYNAANNFVNGTIGSRLGNS